MNHLRQKPGTASAASAWFHESASAPRGCWRPERKAQHACGMTLVEMLVAVLVLSIGLLGIAGLQTITAKYKINTWARSSASTLLSNLSERIRINPDAAGTSFAAEGVDSASMYLISDNWKTQQAATLDISQDCEAVACTAAERAAFDLLAWRRQVRDSMPQGAAMISGDRRNGLTVTMMWFDKEQLPQATASAPLTATAATAKAPLAAAPAAATASAPMDAASAPACSATGTEKGMAQQTCCPQAAGAPFGVRCANFSFIP